VSAFQKVASSHISRWVADPDDDTAHQALLALLERFTDGVFLPSGTELTQIQIGNLGEFMAFFVGRECGGSSNFEHPFCANALNPLSGISISGIDCVWVHFGDTPLEDAIALQEVKTSSTQECEIADSLLDDYTRLFGTNLTTRLDVRLRSIKNHLEIESAGLGLGDRAVRLLRFMVPSIGRLKDTIVIPTLIFDHLVARATAPQERLAGVGAALIARGWVIVRDGPWAIALGNLVTRLHRLATGNV
jgi:hypothetical protein